MGRLRALLCTPSLHLSLARVGRTRIRPFGRQNPGRFTLSKAALEVPAKATRADADSPLYRHSKRPQWGIGILTREGPRSRTYQFEGGGRKKIRKGYYQLLETVDDLGEREQALRQSLLRQADARRTGTPNKTLEPVATFAEQVELFTSLYPEGFQDPSWIEDHRESEGRTLKRHRTSVSSEAREALSAARCEEALAAGSHTELGEVIADLLARTDLVPVSFAKAIRGLDAEETEKFVVAAVELLHGEGEYQDRFRAWVMTLAELFDARPKWRAATVLPALVHPNSHTVVRRSAFRRQAAVVAPSARYSKRARPGSYVNFLRVAQGTRERLSEAGHEPRDLMDVYDFIWTTLRSSALEHLGSD